VATATVQVNVRVTPELHAALERRCFTLTTSKTVVVTAALEAFLAPELELERDLQKEGTK
jgi:hypothetical protein